MPDRVPPAERLERLALEELHAAAPAPVRERLGLRTAVVGTALCSVAEHDANILLNRVIGLGVGAPAERENVEQILEVYRRSGGHRFFLHRHHEARPPELVDWLVEAGLEKTRGWMKFERGVEPPPHVETTLRVERIGPEHASDFGRIVATGFDMTGAAGEVIARLNGRPGWHQFMTFDGDTPAGTGVLFVNGELGWLDMGATLPDFRGRRSQQAIMAERIRHAAGLGCRTLYTTTGEEVPGDPQLSYANILKLGFHESYLRENYAPPR